MLSIEKIAEVCHEANRALQLVLCEAASAHWPECSEDMKASARKGVMAYLENPEITSEDLHEKWCLYKWERGWTRGEVKSESNKTHPNLVPYDQLPREQKLKDALFRNVIHALVH